MKTTVRTRMAPSPTGDLHVGSLMIALRDFAWAKRNNGQFILRIEDTDQTREIEGAEQKIKDILRKFGLFWDEGPDVGGDFGPYVQSQRLPIYKEKAEELVNNSHAYYCFCSKQRLEELREKQRENKTPPKYDGHCRNLEPQEIQKLISQNTPYVVRLKVPKNQTLEFEDLLRGKISFETNEIDDQVLLKSDGFPTYHLAVVVDDHLMKISHVFRGEEWISSAPKHVLLYQAFNWPEPTFVHFPVYLNPDGKGKMSKRKGTVSVESFLSQGYLPEALLNFLMILGWAPKDEDEIMTLERFVDEFDPKDVSSKSVIFDLKKLQWLNGVYIRKLSQSDLAERIQPFLPDDFPKDKLQEILPLVFERLATLGDIEELTDFFYRPIDADSKLLLKKADKQTVKDQLNKTRNALSSLDKWSTDTIEEAIRSLQEQNEWHRGQYFMMLRIASTGKTATPPLFETMSVLDKQLLLNRLDRASNTL